MKRTLISNKKPNGSWETVSHEIRLKVVVVACIVLVREDRYTHA